MPTVKKNPGKKVRTTAAPGIDLKAALQEHFGFKEFKGEQRQIIESLLAGKDTFVIMPTGGGKSLCYQLPAMVSPGVAIIVSPLIALMKNQVDLVRGYSSNDEVAHFLNSTLSKREIKEVHDDLKSGRTKMLYVLPKPLPSRTTLISSATCRFLSSLLMKPTVFQNGGMISGPNTGVFAI